MKRTIGILLLVCMFALGCTLFERGDLPTPITPTPTENESTINETVFIPPKQVYEEIFNETIRYDESPESNLEIYFIDVGLGESTLIKKGNFEILIDAGGDSKKLINFLEEKEINNIELVIATKYTEENVKNIKNVLETFRVQQYWDNGLNDSTNKYYTEIHTVLESKNIPVKHPEFGDSFTLNGININILNPQKEKYIHEEPRLNSITLHIIDRDFGIYFSDMETGMQNSIFSKYGDAKSTFMKIPNLGSSMYSDTVDLFGVIDKVKPDYAVVFSGENKMGLPDGTVLETFRLKKVKTLRTDLNGTISVITDGYDYNITTSIIQEPPKRR